MQLFAMALCALALGGIPVVWNPDEIDLQVLAGIVMGQVVQDVSCCHDEEAHFLGMSLTEDIQVVHLDCHADCRSASSDVGKLLLCEGPVARAIVKNRLAAVKGCHPRARPSGLSFRAGRSWVADIDVANQDKRGTVPEGQGWSRPVILDFDLQNDAVLGIETRAVVWNEGDVSAQLRPARAVLEAEGSNSVTYGYAETDQTSKPKIQLELGIQGALRRLLGGAPLLAKIGIVSIWGLSAYGLIASGAASERAKVRLAAFVSGWLLLLGLVAAVAIAAGP